MLVFFGTRRVHLKTKQLRTISCPNCNSRDSLSLSLYRKHFHLFWVPTFPIGKKGLSECQNCKNILETNEMPKKIKEEYKILKSDTKAPLWQFSGLGVIAILFILLMFVGSNSKKLSKEYISSPEVGDIYKYKLENGNFSTLKVVNISNDSVFVSPNNYEIEKRTRIYKIDKSKNYSKTFYGLSKIDVKNMFDSNQIYDVNR